MRDNPRTLQEAIDKATDEYNLRKRFSLRTGKPFASSNGSGQHPEPMDVDHFNKRPRCFKCGKKRASGQSMPQRKLCGKGFKTRGGVLEL